MSLITKRGDSGETDLLFNKRAPKTSPRIEALGAVDELNAALGLIRATLNSDDARQWIHNTQQKLIALMGHLATLPEDRDTYIEKGYSQLLESDVEEPSAHADLARTICRRAERRLWELNPETSTETLFLNRLSDALWALARNLESNTN